MEKVRLKPCGSREFILMVEEYSEDKFSGKLMHPRLNGEIRFGSLHSLLIIMDDLLDQEDCPCEAASVVMSDVLPQTPLATFKIEVLFRQNQSWQGKILWLEDKSETCFRSVLEFVMIIDGILAE